MTEPSEHSEHTHDWRLNSVCRRFYEEQGLRPTHVIMSAAEYGALLREGKAFLRAMGAVVHQSTLVSAHDYQSEVGPVRIYMDEELPPSDYVVGRMPREYLPPHEVRFCRISLNGAGDKGDTQDKEATSDG